MKIVATYSHLNGLEFLTVNRPDLWREVESIIDTKQILKGNVDNITKIGGRMVQAFQKRHWEPVQDSFGCISKDRVLIEIKLDNSKQTNGLWFVKHLAFYVRDEIDVGIEILPMKSLQQQMSSGPGYYEGELYNVIRNGRGVPAVPLVMIGIAA